MQVTLSEMTMLLKDSQNRNAIPPMRVTLSGITILVKDLQYANAPIPMQETLSGMTYDVVFLSLNAIILLLSLLNNTLLS